MPKDEFDFEDPLELNGMALWSEEDTTDAMTECFIEEFLRMGYDDKQVFALFRNPQYLGMNMVLQNRGEDYVKQFIAMVFARWGKTSSPDAAVTNPTGERPGAVSPGDKMSPANDRTRFQGERADGGAVSRLNP